jgi:hypothetical protein
VGWEFSSILLPPPFQHQPVASFTHPSLARQLDHLITIAHFDPANVLFTAMTRHIWRAADAGVMLWEPAIEVATATAPQEVYPLEQPDFVMEADIQSEWTPVFLPYNVAEQVLTSRKVS